MEASSEGSRSPKGAAVPHMKWNEQYVYNLTPVESTLKNFEMIYNTIYLVSNN